MILHYISGGQRSGKSSYAQNQAISLTERPVYLATAKNWDEEFNQRIKRHQSDRDQRWENIEEQMHLSKLDLQGRVVVLDCITLWLTNIFVAHQSAVAPSLDFAKEEFERLAQQSFTLFCISNELGMGLHADTPVGRAFTDLQGWMNQYLAKRANTATLMVSGLPLKLKG
ncbi:bifunctional adenosylcobinamide kinase/adenosylcobinamide-phosphate guanylyltransferase [Eisenibacter elegans]|jgi:adenosylcobinamide kinase/adenosylcobinamide-phosphate guanylyltransferase|uniref:bifunctional adenosylcobinamide kinase/adenosylcobinamide-phosphate guanylyltransferase n=1 Tax=Eisenibacter elegans TaxID=997 RepID=UPI00316AE612